MEMLLAAETETGFFQGKGVKTKSVISYLTVSKLLHLIFTYTHLSTYTACLLFLSYTRAKLVQYGI